jgi:hypothetical protein
MSELIGRKLGKYTLEAKLGEGGMAAVFSSHHPQFDRPVAIKILPPTIGRDAGFRARFEREGRTIAGLNHPNIIRIYDIDEAEGLFYMVMDLLPGGTLEGRLREGGLDRKWSADVVVKMAEALDYAHTRGVIHRDIKPSNILLDADGHPVLADFGIARLVQGDGEPNLTSAGMVMGTPAYMAPEQLTGQPPDARADIYSLGVVLYQLLAGRAPFTGDTTAVISGHLTRQPPPPRESAPDLPLALDAVVLQALAKQPDHRFKSAGVFAQALRNAASDLEPGIVRVASAARAQAAPTFSGVALPQATGSTGQLAPATPQPPLTAGQQVAKYLPGALGVLGLLLVIGFLLKNWSLVVTLAILIGGGGFLFLYLRASTQGRKAAQATTRAISTSAIRAAAPPDARSPGAEPTATARPTTRLEPGPTQVLDNADDVPEVPLPQDATTIEAAAQPTPEPPTPNEAMSPNADAALPPTEAVSFNTSAALAPTETIPATQTPNLPASQTGSLVAEDLAPTEAIRASASDSNVPTEESPLAAGDTPTATETSADKNEDRTPPGA